MLLANISVAQKIYDEFSECALLRKHPSPPPSNYDILIKAAKSRVSECSVVSSLSKLYFFFNPNKKKIRPYTYKNQLSVFMFLLAFDLSGLNRRNEPKKISMSKKAEHKCTLTNYVEGLFLGFGCGNYTTNFTNCTNTSIKPSQCFI